MAGPRHRRATAAISACAIAAVLPVASIPAASAQPFVYGVPLLISQAADPGSDAAGDPALAASTNGLVVTAAWRSNNATSQGEIYANRTTDGGLSWSTPTRISLTAGSATNAVSRPAVTSSASGDIAAVSWLSNTTVAKGEIYAARFAGGTWTGPTRLSAAGLAATNAGAAPSITSSADGASTTVGWLSLNSLARGEILTSRLTDDVWGAPTRISAAPTSTRNAATSPTLAGSTDNNTINAAWRSTIGDGTNEIRAARFADSGWSTALISDAAGTTTDARQAPAVVSSADGAKVQVAWLTINDLGRGEVRTASFDSGWQAPARISLVGAVASDAQSAPVLGASADASVVTAAWNAYGNGYGEIVSAHYAGSWGDPATISATGDIDHDAQNPPVLAVSTSGSVGSAGWLSYDESAHGEVWAARFIDGAWTRQRVSTAASASSNAATTPRIMAASDGSIVSMGWLTYDSATTQIWTTTLGAGAWEDPLLLEAAHDSAGPGGAPTLVASATADVATAAWFAFVDGGAQEIHAAPEARAPVAPVLTGLTAHDSSLEVGLTQGATGGLPLINYEYSTDGGSHFRALATPDISSPITITKLSTDGTSNLSNGVSYDIQVRSLSNFDHSTASNQLSESPLGDARDPQFGTLTRTRDGFTTAIANYDSAFTWNVTATNGATGAVSGSGSDGLLTVVGLGADESSTASVVTSRTGWTGGTADATGTSLQVGRIPTLGTPQRRAHGFTVAITNFDVAWNWSANSDLGNASIDPAGLVSVAGVAAGASATVTVTASKIGHADEQQSASATALEAARTPTFGTPSRTDDGFAVAITNFDDLWAWDVDSDHGAAVVSAEGVVTVTGLAIGESASATITSSRGNYEAGAAAVTSRARSVPADPTSVTAVPGDRRATVHWSEPVDDGGLPLTRFAVVTQRTDSSPALTSNTCSVDLPSVSPHSCVVTGLSPTAHYRFLVEAYNSIGGSNQSSASASVLISRFGTWTSTSGRYPNSASTSGALRSRVRRGRVFPLLTPAQLNAHIKLSTLTARTCLVRDSRVVTLASGTCQVRIGSTTKSTKVVASAGAQAGEVALLRVRLVAFTDQSSRLSGSARSALAELSGHLSGQTVFVVGHADSSRPRYGLATRRAQAVEGVLKKSLPVMPGVVAADGLPGRVEILRIS